MKLKNARRFQPEKAPKAFSGRDPPGPAGGAYSAPQTHYLDLKGRGRTREGKGKRKDGREGMKG